MSKGLAKESHNSRIKRVSFSRNYGPVSVGVFQHNLVLSTGLIMHSVLYFVSAPSVSATFGVLHAVDSHGLSKGISLTISFFTHVVRKHAKNAFETRAFVSFTQKKQAIT